MGPPLHNNNNNKKASRSLGLADGFLPAWISPPLPAELMYLGNYAMLITRFHRRSEQ